MRIKFILTLGYTTTGEIIAKDDSGIMTVRVLKGKAKGDLVEIMPSQIKAYL